MAGFSDMIGVHDLQLIAIALQLSRNDARGSHWKLLFRPICSPPEESQRQIIAVTIDTKDAQRASRAAPRTMLRDGKGHDDILPDICNVEHVDRLAIGPT